MRSSTGVPCTISDLLVDGKEYTYRRPASGDSGYVVSGCRRAVHASASIAFIRDWFEYIVCVSKYYLKVMQSDTLTFVLCRIDDTISARQSAEIKRQMNSKPTGYVSRAYTSSYQSPENLQTTPWTTKTTCIAVRRAAIRRRCEHSVWRCAHHVMFSRVPFACTLWVSTCILR